MTEPPTAHRLHAIEFPGPGSDVPLELYVRCTGPGAAVDRTQGTVHLPPGGTAGLDTYFNCCTIAAWNRSAPLADLWATVEVDGPCRVEVWHAGAADRAQLLAAIDHDGERDRDGAPPCVRVEVPDHSRLDGVCFLRVVAGDGPITVRGGGWWTTTSPRRPVRLGAVMTTYRREAYVARNVAILDGAARAAPDRFADVRFLVVDNGRTLTLDTEDLAVDLRILPNRNLGGAGGFARGLMAHRADGWATHVVFMDDDIVVPPSLLERTVTFLRIAEDPRQCLSAAMLDERDPGRQYECGARFDVRARHPTSSLRRGLDLTAREALVENARELPIDYAGWWYFAFPLALTDENPLPVFVRGDDVHFGLAHARDRVEVMNGVGVWHRNFDDKNNPATFHLEARNHPLVGVLTDPGYGRTHLLGRMTPLALRSLLALKYATAEHVLAGTREFLAGPDRWLGLAQDDEFARINGYADERARQLDPTEIPPPATTSSPVADLAAMPLLGGHLLPRAMSRRGPASSPLQTRPVGAVVGRESVVYVDPTSDTGFTAHRDRRRFARGLLDVARTAACVWRRFPAAAAAYRARREELVGDEYWRAQFEGRPPSADDQRGGHDERDVYDERDGEPMDWVVLTTGDRPAPLRAAIASLDADVHGRGDVLVVSNGAGPLEELAEGTGAHVVESPDNLGVPGGRDLGIRSATSAVVGFLDDDGALDPGGSAGIVDAFAADPALGAVALRVTDEDGRPTRRHIPIAGGRAPDGDTDVAYFVGCAHALRREAYEQVGGYFDDLFYGHEEIELCWRLVDAGWRVRYLDSVRAFHPRTEISRHEHGWELTGRNRVLIARRTLPWPVAFTHVGFWLVMGLRRAPRRTWRSYLRGWRAGWRTPVDRAPIRYRTVWRLTRLGRPPFI